MEKLTFSGSDSDSRDISRTGVWELELTTPAGAVYRAASGAVSPIMEVVQ